MNVDISHFKPGDQFTSTGPILRGTVLAVVGPILVVTSPDASTEVAALDTAAHDFEIAKA